MKRFLLVSICLLLSCGLAFSQKRDKKLKTKKLNKQEAASLTQEQRIAHEQDRKSNGGKKKLSLKEKSKIQRKQNRAARNTKAPQSGARPKPKG